MRGNRKEFANIHTNLFVSCGESLGAYEDGIDPDGPYLCLSLLGLLRFVTWGRKPPARDVEIGATGGGISGLQRSVSSEGQHLIYI